MKSIFLVLPLSSSFSQSFDISQNIDSINQSIVVGAKKIDSYLPLLYDKSVGIVSNQSSLVDDIHIVDTLLSLDVRLNCIFSPEHGFRGNEDAGDHIYNEIDHKTKLPIISLYGKNKKPTAYQLSNIDVLIFDLQDVGVRFYTYISTLHYVMEACAENNITLIILDRPNPNGHYIDGPVLDIRFSSFVGMHPVPIVYGMTIAEYAKMINGEKWLKNKLSCQLIIISCDNYNHSSPYLLPVPPSPNLRSDISIQLYPSLCLFEATTVSVGRGTDFPFECYGHPDFSKTEFLFIPKKSYGSKNPKHKDKLCNGYNLNQPKYKRLDRFDLSFLLNAKKELEGKVFVNRYDFFNLLAGNDLLIRQLENGMNESQIRDTWEKELDNFKLIRLKYLIYD